MQQGDAAAAVPHNQPQLMLFTTPPARLTYLTQAVLCRYDTALEKANYAALAKQQEDAAATVPDEEEDEADDLEAQLARAR